MTLRWGVLGTGEMARQFSVAIATTPGHLLQAVGSRSHSSAEDLAAGSGASCYGSYDALLGDPAVDVVYVATRNDTHRDLTLRALAAGKPVLCEKPLALDAAEARDIAEAASEAGVFCMEAMWTRFLPAVVRLRELLAKAPIGEVHLFSASLGFAHVVDPTSRLFDPSAGGGALLDLGVYPVSLAHHLLGPPVEVVARDRRSAGVDVFDTITLVHSGGVISSLHCSVISDLANELSVVGSEGRIRLGAPVLAPQRISVERHEPRSAAQTLRSSSRITGRPVIARIRRSPVGASAKRAIARADGSHRVERHPYDSNGYGYQLVEVARCLREGLTQSPIMPLSDSIAVLETLDRVRASAGVGAGPAPS